MGALWDAAYSTPRARGFHASDAVAGELLRRRVGNGRHVLWFSVPATRRMPPTMDPAVDTPAAPALPPANGRRALVVGASSGIGAALVRELVRQGWRVAAVARRGAELEELRRAAPERVVTRVHDVHDVEAVPGLFEELVRELGGLDLCAYVAGVMPKVGPLEFDTEKDREIFAVNTLGAIAWCNPAAEHFQSKRAGVIVGVGSIAGDRGRRPQPVYGASKAAFAHYLEALRNRLSEHGVRVCTIKPGYVDTPMTAGLPLKGAVSADAAARTIVGYARRGSGVRYVPLKWLLVSLVVRSIPSRLFRHLQI
jgi:NAD(P)-dependent dehydrogenase (short-subunit alcohol dehydrogenase family)